MWKENRPIRPETPSCGKKTDNLFTIGRLMWKVRGANPLVSSSCGRKSDSAREKSGSSGKESDPTHPFANDGHPHVEKIQTQDNKVARQVEDYRIEPWFDRAQVERKTAFMMRLAGNGSCLMWKKSGPLSRKVLIFDVRPSQVERNTACDGFAAVSGGKITDSVELSVGCKQLCCQSLRFLST